MRHFSLLLSLFLTASLACFGAVDQSLLALAPAGTKLVASIDVKSAGSSEFGQYLLRRVDSEDKGFQDFIQQTGFDPRRDLENLIFISTGATDAGKDNRGVVLARGLFDTTRLRTMARGKGAAIESYQGTDLLINSRDKTALAFPETGIAVLGDVETVRSVIAHRSNPIPLDPKLARQIEAVGSANDVWFVSPSGAQFLEHAGAQFQGAQALQSILQSSGGIRFGETVRLSVDAITRSRQDADSLAAVARFLRNMVQTQSQNNPKMAILASSLNGMDIQVDGSSVHLSLSMSEKSLEQMAQIEPGRGH